MGLADMEKIAQSNKPKKVANLGMEAIKLKIGENLCFGILKTGRKVTYNLVSASQDIQGPSLFASIPRLNAYLTGLKMGEKEGDEAGRHFGRHLEDEPRAESVVCCMQVKIYIVVKELAAESLKLLDNNYCKLLPIISEGIESVSSGWHPFEQGNDNGG
ncbi:hypothetical protein PV325_007686 [Microctonus aethiopoides]|nr:hypothetical protein PV325_007686 [Microctonus aethiopoides]